MKRVNSTKAAQVSMTKTIFCATLAMGCVLMLPTANAQS